MKRQAVPLPPVFRRSYAHRGLHDAARGVVENTAPAFAAAIALGFGIECDLRSTADGVPIVFHDATLERLIARAGRVDRLRYETIAGLNYQGSDTPILSFDGLLTMVAGKVPLLVEIKSEWEVPNADFLANIADSALRYAGPLALMSFDPAIVAAVADLAPTIPRGLVSGSYTSTSGDGWWSGVLPVHRRNALREMVDFDQVGASFCAYEVAALPTPVTTALRERAIAVFAWTVRTQTDRQTAVRHADGAIFEGDVP
jgi:glycerophosphoryl diester phosphodiesterase